MGRLKLWDAIKQKQDARKKLRKTLAQFKALGQEKLVNAHSAMANATVDLKEAVQVEEEASNAINEAMERLRVYNERKNFVDVIESGLVQSGSDSVASTENPALMAGSNTRLPHSDSYVTASIRLLPSRIHASAANLVAAVRKLNVLLNAREAIHKKLVELREKRAVL